LPVTKSTALQSENIKVAQPEIKKIEKKYEGKTDQESLMKKSQETMAIYKKYKINPMSSCLFAVIQIPLLFAFIEAINRTPAIFEGSLLGLKLGMTPLIAIQKGAWWYIIIVILLGVITYLSFKLNKGAPSNLDNQKQMNIMNTVFVVMIIFMSFSMASAISIYWISSNIFTILQNIVVKRRSEK
ncbi:MAG: YidC/Oxa1 family membrane protein insertase, partial [Bacilli bacterium]|nr:YidC/Oxa1 family membrane protein insertase [Bacilli bacterium]